LRMFIPALTVQRVPPFLTLSIDAL
jgi:hypothetical protein